MSRSLPERPNLDHLKNEAKALLKTLRASNPEAKLTEAQRQLAREYGFPTWAKLRAHVLNSRAGTDVLREFLSAVQGQNISRMHELFREHFRTLALSVHAMASIGQTETVGALLRESPDRINELAGDPPATPLLYACFSPVHRDGAEAHEGMARMVKALIEAGADPNSKDGRYGVPALYGVTGMHNSPRVARILLEAGANPTDGESVFHAAESFHEEALELLWEFGVQLNHVGEWGNTALYFLLRWHDLDKDEKATQGFRWLLDHDADPNIPSGRERETALQVAARRGQPADVIRALLQHGADVRAERGDGFSAWKLATRNGHGELASILEAAGAKPESLSTADELLAACGRGDVAAARRLASPALVASLPQSDLAMIGEAAAGGELRKVEACIAAGFPINAVNGRGATPAHEAAINGFDGIVAALIDAGAALDIRDPEHNATPLGWALFGADFVGNHKGDYEATVRALVRAGARGAETESGPRHPGVRAALGLPPA